MNNNYKLIDRLMEGNKRFLIERTKEVNYPEQAAAAALEPKPFVFIISCIDSRVPVELIFDLNIGESFTARLAGNVITDDIIANAEFVCKYSGIKHILVLGHTRCRAIELSLENSDSGSISLITDKFISLSCNLDKKLNKQEKLEIMTLDNVKRSIEEIKTGSKMLKQLTKKNNLVITGAIYDVDTGKVKFLE